MRLKTRTVISALLVGVCGRWGRWVCVCVFFLYVFLNLMSFESGWYDCLLVLWFYWVLKYNSLLTQSLCHSISLSVSSPYLRAHSHIHTGSFIVQVRESARETEGWRNIVLSGVVCGFLFESLQFNNISQ